MRSIVVLSALLALFWFEPIGAAYEEPSPQAFSGAAYATDSDALLYRETHFLRAGAGGPEHIVLFRCPNGLPFARKVSRDDGDAQAPDFEMTDARLGYREGVRRVGDRREVYVQRSAAQPEQFEILQVPADGVIDMGFEVFARHHWDELQRGDTLRLSFLVPSRRTFYAFKVNRIAADDNAGTVTFRLAVGSWVAFLLPHIDVTYEVATRRLVRYVGLSNVRDLNGKNYRVHYEAPKIAANHAVGAADVEAALAAPLAASCTAADTAASANGQSPLPEVTSSAAARNPNP